MPEFPDHAQLANIGLIEELYAKYLLDPESVDASWRHFFEGIDFAGILAARKGAPETGDRIFELIQAYRRFGHLMAKVNPIETAEPTVPELSLEVLGFTKEELDQPFPTHGLVGSAEAPLREIIAALVEIYGSRIGIEYMDLDNPALERWIQSKVEPKLTIDLSPDEKQLILEQLNSCETLENFLHTKYVGQKRFSLEGGETALPMLAEIIELGAEKGMEEIIIGMAHRGRLNVLANLLNKPYAVIFREFEDTLEGNGDVKYHKGFSSDRTLKSGKVIHLHLSANSSALESVDPIALGLTRAKQVVRNDEERRKVGAILVHGDAALSGQGVVYESLELMHLAGYSTGGTVHLVINNQIGFTTLPEEGRSTRYCTDIAKAFGCPVFHVNAEDPESCVYVAKLALEIRLQFQCDVFIDLNCYRKYGHNEWDEPAFTQPIPYQVIRSKKSIRQIYAEQLKGAPGAQELEEAFRAQLGAAFEKAKGQEPQLPEEQFGSSWTQFKQPADETLFEQFGSQANNEVLCKVIQGFCQIPEGFHLHLKLQKWLKERLEMFTQGSSIDWATAECLAFGSLLLEGTPVRLAGQDSRRGTFSQRHAMWVDQENGVLYFPFSHLDPKQARADIINSPLSEFASLGFEYGYSWGDFRALVLWEAQYGDFAIGAQTIIDHYITTSEQKWARYSSLVLLLPHGYQGEGPEHSSARVERFLQLAGYNSIQIANPTNPAQYFHLLRRQALRKIKKPLIVLTPKAILRLAVNVSPLNAFTTGEFQEVLDDPTSPQNPSRVLFCSGKVYYDLLTYRKQTNVAIIRIEQLYPFHRKKFEQIISRYTQCKDFRWVQEEPQNMGPAEYIQPLIQSSLPKGAVLRYVGRVRSAATATGSHKKHAEELDQFMKEAFL